MGTTTAIRVIGVDTVDNTGLPCEHCMILGRGVDTNVYYYRIEDGERTMEEACLPCARTLIARHADPDYPVEVEVAIGSGV